MKPTRVKKQRELIVKTIRTNRIAMLIVLFVASGSVYGQQHQNLPPFQSFSKTYKVRGNIEYVQPIDLKDGIETVHAESLDINLPLLMQAVNEIEQDNQMYKSKLDKGATAESLDEDGCIDSFLLFKDGHLALEEYFGYSAIDIPHIQMSITKSVTSYAVGIAIDQGTIKSENDFILDYLPKVDVNKLSENSKKIRIRDILSMQSGIRLSNVKLKEVKVDNKWVEHILAHSNTLVPGTSFEYNSFVPEIIVHILYNATKTDMTDYVDKHLFTPLGITDYSFDKTVAGLTRASWGMKLRSRDMLKLGILALNEGEYNGKRIISEDWVRITNRKHADSGNFKYDYGYFWWPHTVSYKNKQYKYNFCWGAYGQFIIVIPRLNSVVVFTSNGTQKGFSVLENVIIPAIVNNK